MRVGLLTANFGRYKQPSPLPLQVGCDDAVLVTDDPDPTPGWRNVVVDLGPNARLASKSVKCFPERYVEADVVVWIDAAFRVTSALLVQHCLAAIGDGHIAVLEHPWRHNLLDEARAGSTGAERFQGRDIIGQAHSYLARGHPSEWGVYWTAILVRRMSNMTKAFGEAWFAEQKKWSLFDQVSMPFVCRRILGRPRKIPFPFDHVVLPGYPP